MTKSFHFLILMIVAIGLVAMLGCGGGAARSQTTPPITNVYVAGYEANASGVEVAKYWKDGVAVPLSDGTHNSVATSIFVSGTDVHVAGFEFNGSVFVAKYWKNGVGSDLTDGTKYAVANSIFVSGSDVYIAGREYGPPHYDVAQYWKNGVPVILTDNTETAEAFSVVVAGSDVYVAGYENKLTQINHTNVVNPVAKYWKNGVPVELSDGLTVAFGYSIFVAGSDVYVAGSLCQVVSGNCDLPTYWKNGTPIQLSNVAGTSVSSVFASGTHIYASESGTSDAQVWKDGAPTLLTKGATNAGTNQVVVSGTDIYAAGYDWGGARNYAEYWKNGVPVLLNDGTHQATALSIAIVSH